MTYPWSSGLEHHFEGDYRERPDSSQEMNAKLETNSAVGDLSSSMDTTPISDSEKAEGHERYAGSLPPRKSTEAKYDHPEKPKIWQAGEPYRFAPKKTGEPWEELIKEVKKYDKEEVEGWREDIDTLLVFAGLFSAAVTAFTVESYQWLQQDPTETNTQLLYQISLQLANLSQSSSILPNNPSQEPFTPTSSSIRINILWFLSLILALSSALLSILCKQWLREYCRDTHTKTQMQALVLRQLRYTSFQKWHVRTFITCLPLLLELALLLFFAGILELLWSLHHTVAILASTVVGCTVVFFFTTAMLPTYSFFKMVPSSPIGLPRTVSSIADPSNNVNVNLETSESDLKPQLTTFCPYKSPLAWLFFRLFHLLHSRLFPSSESSWGERFSKITNWSRGDLEIIKDSPYHNTAWGYYHLPDQRHLQLLDLGLKWTVDAFGDSARMAGHIFHCLSGLEATLPSDSYLRSLGVIFADAPKAATVSNLTVAGRGSGALEDVPSGTIFRFLDHRYEEGNNVFLGELTLRALNEASTKTPECLYQYLQTGFFYITLLFEHALSRRSESPELLHEVIYQVESSINKSISSHMRSRSSNNINFLVLRLCERMAFYKDPLMDEAVLFILDFMLGELEHEIHIRPLLWIRTDLLDVICNFVFLQGGFSTMTIPSHAQLGSTTPVVTAKAQSVFAKLKNLLVKDSLRWETVSVNPNSEIGSANDDDRNSLREWEEFWEEYLRTDYILPYLERGSSVLNLRPAGRDPPAL
ncbi:hypothetical protein D9758_004340 [Tetrapyrgos nigripes]|uniref:DUF6535 domain-containing protein n=1 Tax=Tetrapyrgos nigripes TaxID=182062 RepID=A0A8H5GN10_9AGAR|nr:hypothetical protein D9758_004340 [Tetrapyrgos nigripes]